MIFIFYNIFILISKLKCSQTIVRRIEMDRIIVLIEILYFPPCLQGTHHRLLFRVKLLIFKTPFHINNPIVQSISLSQQKLLL